MSFGSQSGDEPVTEPGAAPWASDLERLSEDPETRAAFDQYLREQWQPRMTQLEQQARVSQDAQNLWTQLGENPGETVVSIIDQMFDSESAEKVYAALNGDQGPEAQQQAQQVVQQAAAETTAQEYAKLDPQTQALIDSLAAKEQEQQYFSELEQAIDANHDLNADLLRKHVHSFVVAANGDIPEGIARYRAFVNEFGAPATDAEVESNAPNVMGNEGAASNGAPVEVRKSWDEAFKDFETALHDSNARPAPPVGTA